MAESPIGTIAAYAGPTSAAWENTNGWLVCDGRSLNRTNASYAALFNQIGSSWGGDGVDQFNIPDLRGYFLRGVDGAAGRDPDKDGRAADNPGGHAGNQVGSVQVESFANHGHLVPGAFLQAQGGGGFIGSGFASNSGNNPAWSGPYPTSSVGGSETRPKNAYVYWVIRYA